jgi:predicted secreted acid phosphatase
MPPQAADITSCYTPGRTAAALARCGLALIVAAVKPCRLLPLTLVCLVAGLCILSADTTTPPAEPPNLSDAKAAVVAYVEDGRYEHDLAAAAAKAREWIETRAAARRPGERLAVVFDIDETVLSNLPVMRAEDFGYNSRDWVAWIEKAAAPALVPVREVFKATRAANVAVLFLSGRQDPRDLAGTAKNLEREGMSDYAALQLTPTKGEKLSSHDFKTAARARWAAEGWTIIATIGDQESDLGEHAERSFKLPNPFYRIP